MRNPFLIAAVSLTAAMSAHATLVADYQLDNSYASSTGTAPALVPIGSPSFVSDSVYGSRSTVLSYPAGSGLSLATDTILPGGTIYTILIRGRHDPVDGFAKLIDFAGNNADYGLYDNNGSLNFYDLAGGTTLNFGYGYTDVVLTRSNDGALAGYVNGVLQISADDSVNLEAAIDPSVKALIFFVDDTVTAGAEVSAGAVARIQIWNTALTAEEVAAISVDQIFGDGFEVGPTSN